MNVFDVVAGQFSLTTLVALVLILGLSGIMSGLSGFGFSDRKSTRLNSSHRP